MRRPMRMRVIVIAFASACGFAISTLDVTEPTEEPGTGGAVTADAYVPDAGGCQVVEAVCVETTLRTCTSPGSLPTDEACAWGCSSAGQPHCAKLQPHGGGVTPTDLDPSPGLGDITINTQTIDSDSGEISNVRPAGTGLINGIEFHVANHVGVFRFNKLTLQGLVNVRGINAVALVSVTRIDTVAEIDVRGTCSGTAAGPGAQPGGNDDTAGPGSGGGGAGATTGGTCTGGGGGGGGAAGGRAGGATNGGASFGDPTITTLRGGGGGGGGDGEGGGGGGAIQLAANGTIRIEGLGVAGGINAGGCGGRGASDCGGGGGAGGTILIEAPIIELSNSVLAVNGGGGAGGKDGKDGGDSHLSATKAGGGSAGSVTGGKGGDGGARGSLAGQSGEDRAQSGAGGGGVGRIRFYTYTGSIVINLGTTLSPSLIDNNTSTTRGAASVQ